MAMGLSELAALLRAATTGMQDRIRPQEELAITITKAPQVFCSHCAGVTGYLRAADQPAGLDNIAPLAADQRPGWLCPHCRQDIRYWLPAGAAIKTTKGVVLC